MACSDIPFECPISEVRVARINGEYVINPTFEQMKDADMDIMVGASAENIMMVEGEMKEVSEQDMIGALKAAMAAIKPMCELQTELSKELGTDVKREYCHEVNDEELREQLRKETYDKCYAIAESGDHDKKSREEAFDKILSDFQEAYDAAHTDLTAEELDEKHAEMVRYYADVMRDSMRRCITEALSSHVARHSRSLHVHSVQRWTRSWLTTFLSVATSVSSSTITSRRSAQAKLRLSAA